VRSLRYKNILGVYAGTLRLYYVIITISLTKQVPL